MTAHSLGLAASVRIRGTFECRNDAGEVLKTIDLDGSVALEDLGLTQEQKDALIKEALRGTINRE